MLYTATASIGKKSCNTNRPVSVDRSTISPCVLKPSRRKETVGKKEGDKERKLGTIAKGNKCCCTVASRESCTRCRVARLHGKERQTDLHDCRRVELFRVRIAAPRRSAGIFTRGRRLLQTGSTHEGQDNMASVSEGTTAPGEAGAASGPSRLSQERAASIKVMQRQMESIDASVQNIGNEIQAADAALKAMTEDISARTERIKRLIERGKSTELTLNQERKLLQEAEQKLHETKQLIRRLDMQHKAIHLEITKKRAKLAALDDPRVDGAKLEHLRNELRETESKVQRTQEERAAIYREQSRIELEKQRVQSDANNRKLETERTQQRIREAQKQQLAVKQRMLDLKRAMEAKNQEIALENQKREAAQQFGKGAVTAGTIGALVLPGLGWLFAAGAAAAAVGSLAQVCYHMGRAKSLRSQLERMRADMVDLESLMMNIGVHMQQLSEELQMNKASEQASVSEMHKVTGEEREARRRFEVKTHQLEGLVERQGKLEGLTVTEQEKIERMKADLHQQLGEHVASISEVESMLMVQNEALADGVELTKQKQAQLTNLTVALEEVKGELIVENQELTYAKKNRDAKCTEMTSLKRAENELKKDQKELKKTVAETIQSLRNEELARKKQEELAKLLEQKKQEQQEKEKEERLAHEHHLKEKEEIRARLALQQQQKKEKDYTTVQNTGKATNVTGVTTTRYTSVQGSHGQMSGEAPQSKRQSALNLEKTKSTLQALDEAATLPAGAEVPEKQKSKKMSSVMQLAA
ncbi:hypothetical protein FVE85_9723 [Porphyridium purpureum]|uniref:Uncharacterized protein n=1 Tax=Porphyridium purpureum TaxID=35688 RepID=A0A5J4YJS5_PORPP|nr:hypothetical protein FVE85_9723 [Porphyridium purpureum]|eukprot:POR3239..scf246_12